MNQAVRKKLKARLDKLCSEYIRRRALVRCGGCERCGHPKTDWHELQWAHLISRNYLKTRFNPDASCGLCGGCHRYIDSVNPRAKEELAVKLLGSEKYEILYAEAQKGGTVDYKLWELYLTEELKSV